MDNREKHLRQEIEQLRQIPRELWIRGSDQNQQFQCNDSTVTGGLAITLTGRPIMHWGSSGSSVFRTKVEYSEGGVVPAEDGWVLEVKRYDITFANAQHNRQTSYSLEQVLEANSFTSLGSCYHRSGGFLRRKHPLQLLFEELCATVPRP